MELNLARHVLRTAFRAERELEELLSLLKMQLNSDEYRRYALGIAAAIDAMNVALVKPALASHPELTDEIESSLISTLAISGSG